MPRRLMTLRQIHDEKFGRSRSHIFALIAAMKFPKPIDTGSGGPNLWLEEEVDRFVADLIATAKKREAPSESAAKRTERAQQLVEARQRKSQAAA